MSDIVDFFFSDFSSVPTRRLQAALLDGLAHGSRIISPDPEPGQAVTLLLSSNAQKPINRVAVYYTIDGSDPVGSYGLATNGAVVYATLTHEVAEDSALGLHIYTWEAIIPQQMDGTLVRYCADGWNEDDSQLHWYADQVDPITLPIPTGRIFSYHVDRWHPPAWWHDAIVYQVLVDRFNTASSEPPLHSHDDHAITDFYGGTLRGLIEKLDYIRALGCNCIWLSPIFESPTAHGYNPSDYYNVARRYGSNEDLRDLIHLAHQNGMRVLLDFVANHTSDQHEAFLQALQDPTSEKAQWYDLTSMPGHYRSYADVPSMPELSTDYPSVRSYLYAAAVYWLSYYGADGFRLDYVPGPSMAFWTGFQQAIKEHQPTALTLGEITVPQSELTYYAGRVDAYMDFPLAKLLRSTFASRTTSLADLLHFLSHRLDQMPPSMSSASLLDNHDTHRFLWLADGNIDRLKLAVACQMTLEDTPIIYYGTEVGLSQYGDAHKENAYSRAPMFWDQRRNLDLLDYYRHLITLRQRYKALRSSNRLPVPCVALNDADVQQVGAYLCYQEQEYALIVLNNNECEAHIEINLLQILHDARIAIAADEQLQDLLNIQSLDSIHISSSHIPLSVAPLRAKIYIQIKGSTQ